MSKLLTLVVAGVLMIFTGAPASAKRANSPNLAEVAVEVNTTGSFAGQFSTLIALVVSDAEILKILTSPGQHTVFAPTNAAFDGLFAAAGALNRGWGTSGAAAAAPDAGRKPVLPAREGLPQTDLEGAT